VAPPLAPEDWMPHYLRTIRRCIVEDRSEKDFDSYDDYLDSYIMSRYEAAWVIQAWFRFYWRRKADVPEQHFAQMKEFMENLALNTDDAIRRAITDGALEHMFEIPAIRDYFSDWLRHPVLKQMYEEALSWGRVMGEDAAARKQVDRALGKRKKHR
jgi:hypothetical protein